MRMPRFHLSVRAMMALVAVVALLAWGWMTYLDPVRLWRAAIRDGSDMNRRNGALVDAANGRVRGLTADRAVDEILGLLGDPTQDRTARWTAARALPNFAPGENAPRTIPVLTGALRDGSSAVRVGAAVAIRQILGDHPEDGPTRRLAVAGLVAALKDPDPRVRHWSACSLGWIGEGEAAIPSLVASLGEPGLGSGERKQVLNALGRSGPKAVAALPAVVGLVEADSLAEGDDRARIAEADVLIEAARFLHAFGEPDRAVAVLGKLAGDRDPRIAREAGKALRRVELARQPAGSPP